MPASPEEAGEGMMRIELRRRSLSFNALEENAIRDENSLDVTMVSLGSGRSQKGVDNVGDGQRRARPGIVCGAVHRGGGGY